MLAVFSRQCELRDLHDGMAGPRYSADSQLTPEPMLHFFRLFRDAAVPPREEILDNFPENFKNHSIFFCRFFGDFYSVEELVESGNVIAGSPEDVANEIQRQRGEIGSEHLMCIVNFGNLTHGQTIRSMELFAREVMPRFDRN
ncbi:hypothetical protein [Ferviditalea candida]|uniref:Luciferase-like domain-containing protein n=1 Tax=Ferviditalea candida TaxID=3108399 RepID=A0ABU5ZFJ6_9BACL|nr:hypothetical protein [Paenibacillaceae bacterium T2]